MTETADNLIGAPCWAVTPKKAGWYLVWVRGRYPDFIYFSGESDDPCFQPVINANYFGPIRLPLI